MLCALPLGDGLLHRTGPAHKVMNHRYVFLQESLPLSRRRRALAESTVIYKMPTLARHGTSMQDTIANKINGQGARPLPVRRNGNSNILCCTRYFTYTISFNLHSSQRRYYHYPYFANEEMVANKVEITG